MTPADESATKEGRPAMPSLISKQYHQFALQFLIAAMVKAKGAQRQLWDNAQPKGRQIADPAQIRAACHGACFPREREGQVDQCTAGHGKAERP